MFGIRQRLQRPGMIVAMTFRKMLRVQFFGVPASNKWIHMRLGGKVVLDQKSCQLCVDFIGTIDTHCIWIVQSRSLGHRRRPYHRRLRSRQVWLNNVSKSWKKKVVLNTWHFHYALFVSNLDGIQVWLFDSTSENPRFQTLGAKGNLFGIPSQVSVKRCVSILCTCNVQFRRHMLNIYIYYIIYYIYIII